MYRDGCREMQPMALAAPRRAARPSVPREGLFGGGGTETAHSGPRGVAGHAERSTDVSRRSCPPWLPEIMPSLRIRQMTPFGNMHVKVSVDPRSGASARSSPSLARATWRTRPEAICRILSLWLRSNGSIETAVGQLSGIGSSLSVPTKDGRIMSLADGLATAP